MKRLHARAWCLSTMLIVSASAAQATESLIAPGEVWRYFKGIEEASEPITAWRQIDFDDSGWLQGPSGFGIGDGDDATILSDMADNYISVFLRKTFVVDDPNSITGLDLSVDYDDGFVAYLNGVEVARRRLLGDPVPFDASALAHEAGIPETFALSPFLLLPGNNVLAIQVHNVTKESMDLSMIPALACASAGVVERGLAFARNPRVTRGTATTMTVLGTSSVDLSAFSSVVTYDATRLRCEGQSFVGTVWSSADFRLVDDSAAGILNIGVVEDTTNSGSFVPQGAELPFLELLFRTGLCTGRAVVAFGSARGDNILVDVNAVGFDVLGGDLVSGFIDVVGGNTFVRGNANNSVIDFSNGGPEASVTLADATFILHDIFANGSLPPCLDAADADNDGLYNIADALRILQYLFGEGSILSPPFTQIGTDSGASLGCRTGSESVGCEAVE